MPADAVKLNRILMWQADNDPKGGPLVEALVFMAKNLSLKVIAEGVETQNQVDLLHSCGCDYLQGFYYSPTLTPDELVKALTAVAVK
jgi:EAL domain-containing protein (putative c-di-GMP-specific phosphodiesterase class I)